MSAELRDELLEKLARIDAYGDGPQANVAELCAILRHWLMACEVTK
jgi:hypothetical protein